MAEQIIEIPEGYTEDDVNQALALLESTRQKRETQKAKRAEKLASDPNFKEAQKLTHLRYQAKRNILIRKAVEAGCTVTDQEIDEELSTK